MNKEINDLAKILWDYNLMHQELRIADCIFVLGSRDTRVAERAAELFNQNFAPYVIFAGGYGKRTKEIFTKPEAEIFADIAMEKGVPKDKIIIENKSSNTGDNIKFTKKIIEEKNLNFKKFILVQKPYMERRTYATFQKQWPGKIAFVTSPLISFENYPNGDITFEYFINALVGDTQRIKIYSENGFIISQEMPLEVWQSYEKLVQLGFNKNVIKENAV